MKRVAGLLVAFVSLALVAYACTDATGSPNAVLSIQFDSLGAPSVVLGDTLRDTTGQVVTPQVHAFNFKGVEITPPSVRFNSPDSGVHVDSITGIVTGDSLRATPARVVVTVGSLQAIQKVDVTLRPDFIVAVNGRDSLSYSLIDTTLDVSPQLTVKLSHGVAPADSAVKSWIVSFSVVSASDPRLGDLVDESGRISKLDTTDASGVAGRAIRLHPLFLSSATVVDSIVVNATARYRGVEVTGSPVRLVLKLKPRG
jgi:hypothetical protein